MRLRLPDRVASSLPSRRALAIFGAGLLVGGFAGVFVYAAVSGDVGTPSTHVFTVPDASGPTALRDITGSAVADALKLRGFTCGSVQPTAGDDARSFYRCVLVGNFAPPGQQEVLEKPVFTVTLAGSEGALASIRTRVIYAAEAQLRNVVSRWAEIATSFDYRGAAPRDTRRWLLGAYRSGGVIVSGDAYLDAVAGQGYLQLDVHARGDWPKPPPERATDLARRYAPVLRLSDAPLDPEPFVPLSIRTFARASKLTIVHFDRDGGRQTEFTDTTPGVAQLRAPIRCRSDDKTCYVALDVGGRQLGPRNRQGYVTLERQLAPRPTVYWHAARAGTGTIIQYWFLYLFNDFSANQHESDWEHIAVYLDQDQIPLALFYSSHTGGTARQWRSLVNGFGLLETHPVVWAARGSHANYFSSGSHQVEVCRLGFCAHALDATPPEFRELKYAEPGDGYDLVGLVGRPLTVGFGTGNFVMHGTLRIDDHPFDDPRARAQFSKPLAEFNAAAEAE